MRTELLNIVSQAAKLSREAGITDSILREFDRISENVNAFRIRVPLMGGFNAGKSTLLNTYLGDDILPTEVLPETAIATEIHYGSETVIIAHRRDGSTQSYELSDLKQLPVNELLYIDLYLPNPKLQTLSDIVLVDMPGLDSTLEQHNQAILNYIDKNVFYVVVADCEYGLKDSVLRFLKELQSYDTQFAVLISKAEKKLPSDIEDIVSNANRVASSLAGRDVYTRAISAFREEIAGFTDAIQSIDKNAIWKAEFKLPIESVLGHAIQYLRVQLDAQFNNTAEIDAKITQLNRDIEDARRKIVEEGTKIRQRFESETKRQILNDIEQALRANVAFLTAQAKQGTDAFQRALQDVLRPVLVRSLNEHAAIVLHESGVEVNNSLNSVLEKVGAAIKMLSGLNGVLQVLKDGKLKAILAGVAIFTNVLAPIFEALILFLPDIIAFFINVDKRVREKLENEVFPRILTTLEPQIQQALETVQKDFVEKVTYEMHKQEEELVAALADMKQQKADSEADFRARMDAQRDRLKQLEALQIQVQGM